MLVRSPVVERMTGSKEALIAAKFLLPLPGIELKPDIAPITYLHLLFDRHEIVSADGAPSESLFLGPLALEMLGPECGKEINSLLPKMECGSGRGLPARLFLERRRLRQTVNLQLQSAEPILASNAPRLLEPIGATVADDAI
jgi:hypothetical protein